MYFAPAAGWNRCGSPSGPRRACGNAAGIMLQEFHLADIAVGIFPDERIKEAAVVAVYGSARDVVETGLKAPDDNAQIHRRIFFEQLVDPVEIRDIRDLRIRVWPEMAVMENQKLIMIFFGADKTVEASFREYLISERSAERIGVIGCIGHKIVPEQAAAEVIEVPAINADWYREAVTGREGRAAALHSVMYSGRFKPERVMRSRSFLQLLIR